MCEYVSFLASDSGPTLQLYYSTGLNAHDNIREAYNIVQVGAECEWTGNSPDKLKVRHEDKDTAKLIKQMILDRYPNLKDMLQDIKSVRDMDGTEHTVSQDTYLTPEERKAAIPGMLEKHKLWVESEGEEGVCADFSWWNLYSVNLLYANLQYANLQNTNLRNANLQNTNLHGANLWDTDLRYAYLQDTNLRFADLQGANLNSANLQGANLQFANLQGAFLKCAELQGADLQGANLQNAYLRNADLRNAILQGANLQNANLYGADLQGANLRDANLQGAKVDNNVPDCITK
jgi:hypothetical protein